MMAARPDLGGDQIESLMYSTAVDLGAAGRDPVFGYGRVDAAAAVRAAVAYQPPVDTTAPVAAIAAPLANSSVSGLVGVTVNASDNVGVARVDLTVASGVGNDVTLTLTVDALSAEPYPAGQFTPAGFGGLF